MYLRDSKIESRRAVLLIGVVALLLLSGCATSGKYHTITFGSGTMTVQNDTFVMDGNVSVGVGAQPYRNFSDVTVVLYASNRSPIQTVEVGTLSPDPDLAPLKRRVNVTTEAIPEYVVIRSPDFWMDDVTVKVLGYRRTGTDFEEYFRGSRNQTFPGKSD